VAAYTALQLFEVLVAAAIVLFGVMTKSPILSLLGAGYLIGKAVLNILALEGGSVYRRSLIGYAIAAIFVVGGAIVVHFSG
jgi:hypothetical protein